MPITALLTTAPTVYSAVLTTDFPMLTYQVGIAGAGRLGTASAITILFLPFFLILIFILTRRMLAEEL